MTGSVTRYLYGNPDGQYALVVIHHNLDPAPQPSWCGHLPLIGTIQQTLQRLYDHATVEHAKLGRHQQPPGNGPQAQMARLLGISQQSVSRYLSNGDATTLRSVDWGPAVRGWYELQSG